MFKTCDPGHDPVSSGYRQTTERPRTMLDSKHTRSKHTLQPTKNLVRRSFPALQLEIGEDEADLLLQLDHWIAYEGWHGWIKTSAATIQARAFPTWSERKISGVINRMAESGYIYLACQIWPTKDRSPMIALNYEVIKNLVSVSVAWSAVFADGPQELRRGPQKLRKGPQKLRTDTLYIYKESFKEDLPQEREEAPDPTQPDPAHIQEILSLSQYQTFALALANVCSIDYDLNRAKIQASALSLWEAGYHDPEDLFDLKHWWFTHDFRGRDNNSPPHLSQIPQVIKQALNHPETQKRRKLRNIGADPDNENPAYQFLAGLYTESDDADLS